MRHDMSKVITERPRWGHQIPSRKTGARIDVRDQENEYEDQPKHLPIWWSANGKDGGKEFTDRLGPLRRYLRANVGRPWDKVLSEMKSNLDLRSVTGRHVFEHVKGMVEQECFIGKDGKVYAGPCRVRYLPADGLYVNPRTGLLCWKEPRNYWREVREAQERTKEITRVRIDRAHSYLKINGIWYIAEIAPWTKAINGKLTPPPAGSYQVYERWFAPVRKKQCSKAELKAAGLSNESLT